MKKYRLNIIAPLLFCVLICIFYRSADTNSNILLHYFFGDNYLSLKSTIQQLFPIDNFFIHIIPAALWIFSATLLADGLKFNIGKYNFPLIYAPILYVIGLELLQLFHITNGQFDFMDLVFPLIAWATAYIVLQAQKEHLNHSWIRYTSFFIVFCSVYMADTHFNF